MKHFIALILTAFAFTAFAADKAPATKQETNCVKKDKNGKCPPPPKGEKPKVKKKTAAVATPAVTKADAPVPAKK
jgi:hypothetical protein